MKLPASKKRWSRKTTCPFVIKTAMLRLMLFILAVCIYLSLRTGHDLRDSNAPIIPTPATADNLLMSGAGMPEPPMANMKTAAENGSVPAIWDVTRWRRPGDVPAVVVCHASWHGIRSASLALQLPVFFQNDTTTIGWDLDFISLLRRWKIKRVLIEGVPPRAIKLASRLTRANIAVYVVYHGSLSQQDANWPEVSAFSNLLQAQALGVVKKIGVVKHDMIQGLAALGIVAAPIWNQIDTHGLLTGPRFGTFDGRIHIGVLGEHIPRKNILTQIMAACSIPDTVVHIMRLKPAPPFLKFCRANVVQHEKMANSAFRTLLSKMDVNLYVSLSECQPMVALESISAGVPCLISDTSDIFVDNPKLQNLLVCRHHDSVDAIKTALERVIAARGESLSNELRGHVEVVNARAHQTIATFLDVPMHRVFPTRLSRDFGRSDDVFGTCSEARLEHVGALPAMDVDKYAQQAQRCVRGFRRNRRGAHVFATYELPGVTRGGAGTLIASLAREMVARGRRVILLVDLAPASAADSWLKREQIARPQSTGLLDVVHLASIAKIREHANAFVAKSDQWSRGVEALMHTRDISSVEFFEYAGPASLLLAKAALSPFQRTMRKQTRIYVRVHGSLEMIDAAEGVKGVGDDRRDMYAMERAAMTLADAVIFPTMSLMRIYVESMGLSPRRVAIGAPPVEDDLRALREGSGAHTGREGPESERCPRSAFEVAHVQAGNKRPFRMAQFGRIQQIKSPRPVMIAFSQFIRNHPELSATFTFVGPISTESLIGDGLKHALSAVPESLRDRVHWVDNVDRRDLVQMYRCFDAVVIASTFESFNLVAHEAYHFGVPLIISDWPVFAEFFNTSNSYSFKRQSVTSLASAMHRAVADHEQGRAFKRTPIRYPDPLEVYDCLSRDSGLKFDTSREMCQALLAVQAYMPTKNNE